MARCSFVILVSFLLLGAALGSTASKDDDVVPGSLLEAEAATSAAAKTQVNVADKAKLQVLAQSGAAATVTSTAKLSARADGDNGVSKPWDFFATGTTLTMTWIAFAILVVIVMGLGMLFGCLLRMHNGDGKAKAFDIDTNAHALYT